MTLDAIRTAPMTLFEGTELLTLSACNTATGGGGEDGREVEGFAVIAQQQGAKAVIATLWPVADKSTLLLMQMFYRYLIEHPSESKAEGLRQAQLTLLSRIRPVQAPYSHPYFWAPFILIGNWR